VRWDEEQQLKVENGVEEDLPQRAQRTQRKRKKRKLNAEGAEKRCGEWTKFYRGVT
jgi:hypothetical protein